MIRIENVSKSFLINNQDSKVINNIELQIKKKEIFGIVGPTGSGKSTILRLMTGFIDPNEGKVYLMGELLNKISKRELVKETSMIFQDFNLLGNLTALDNVILPSKLRKNDKLGNIERAKELLSFVGLSDFEKAYPKTLSGGQKQRVAIARSLMTNPKVLFCDEPTSALDEVMSYDVLKLLRKINTDFDTTIVVVSHDISVIRSLCNRVAIIEDGRVAELLELKLKELIPVSYREALLDD